MKRTSLYVIGRKEEFAAMRKDEAAKQEDQDEKQDREGTKAVVV